MSVRIDTDIFISGGGLAGLVAAAAFGAAGFRTLCVDPAPPVTDAEDPRADLRTTAILTPGTDILAQAGLWPRLLPHAAPLQVMRIVDAGAAPPGAPPRASATFDAAEVGDAPFGWNLANWLLRREILAHLAGRSAITFRPGVGTDRVLLRSDSARVRLDDGTIVTARLAIAADGRASPLREAAGIGVRTFRYGQKALSFAVHHGAPHDGVSTEIHRSGGPFTLVPLPDRDGRPTSAVVWMTDAADADRLAALPAPDFEAAMDDRSLGLLGPLRLASRRSLWPILSQLAARMAGERTALIAEAAHVVPPIGAQGLNMSLADIGTLVALAQARPDSLGDQAMLDAYHRARHAEVTARVIGIDALNRASQGGHPLWQGVRATTLRALYAAAPVRRGLMRAGLGQVAGA